MAEAPTREQLDAMFDADPEMQSLLADLPKAWATIDADPVEALVGPHVRAAYGRGYIDALRMHPPDG